MEQKSSIVVFNFRYDCDKNYRMFLTSPPYFQYRRGTQASVNQSYWSMKFFFWESFWLAVSHCSFQHWKRGNHQWRKIPCIITAPWTLAKMAMLVLLIVHICMKLLQQLRSAIQRLLPPSRAHSYICRPANAICQRAIPRSTEARLEKAPYSKCSLLHQDCNLEFVNEFWYKTSTLYNTTDFQDRESLIWWEDMEDRNGRNSFFHSAGNCSSLVLYCYWWSKWS